MGCIAVEGLKIQVLIPHELLLLSLPSSGTVLQEQTLFLRMGFRKATRRKERKKERNNQNRKRKLNKESVKVWNIQIQSRRLEEIRV